MVKLTRKGKNKTHVHFNIFPHMDLFLHLIWFILHLNNLFDCCVAFLKIQIRLIQPLIL